MLNKLKNLFQLHMLTRASVAVLAAAFIVVAVSCGKEEDPIAAAPPELKVTSTVNDDNSGNVTFKATAKGATSYKLLPGDDSAELESSNGEFDYTYAESGTYKVTATAFFVSGDPVIKEVEVEVEVDEDIIVGPTTLIFPITFESSTINYAWDGYGAPGGGKLSTEIVDNPDKNDDANVDLKNTSNKVLKMVKFAESEVWAGALLLLDEPLDFATNGTKIKFKIWAPTKDADVLLKIESLDADGNIVHDISVEAKTTIANAWQTLTFDYAKDLKSELSYNQIVISYDVNKSPTEDITSYYDDFEFVKE